MLDVLGCHGLSAHLKEHYALASQSSRHGWGNRNPERSDGNTSEGYRGDAMRGQGRVYKRKGSPFWQIEFWVKGKRHAESSKSTTKQVAKDLLEKRRQEYRLVPGLERKVTVSDVLEEYIQDCKLRGIRSLENTSYRAGLIKNYIGHEKAADIDAGRIRELQRKLADTYGNGTVNTIVAVLKSALRFAAVDGRIALLPAFPRRLLNPLPRQVFLEHSDYLAILGELEPWAADVFRFSYFSGWRKNEVLSLRWENVDLEAKFARLDPARSKNRDSRLLPIVGELEALLRERLRARVLGSPWVFHRDGKPVSDTTYGKYFNRACEISGRAGKHPHDTRRTKTRNLERAGVPRTVGMKLLGHKSESSYIRYGVVSEAELAGWEEKHQEYVRQKDAEIRQKVLKFGTKVE
jgi:integrase